MIHTCLGAKQALGQQQSQFWSRCDWHPMYLVSYTIKYFLVGGDTSAVLMQVMVPIIGSDKCRKPDWYGDKITDNMLCAGYKAGRKDACQVKTYINTWNAARCRVSLIWRNLAQWTLRESSIARETWAKAFVNFSHHYTCWWPDTISGPFY